MLDADILALRIMEKSIDFHYIKLPDYRVFHVDGAIGGATPKGGLSISFFSERAAIPQSVTHALTETGALGSETNRVSKQGIIREIECGILFDLATAKDIHEWLGKHIMTIEAQVAKAQTKSSS
jgi:hypothetical protein